MNQSKILRTIYIPIIILLYLFEVKAQTKIIDATEIFKTTQNSIVKIYSNIIDELGILQGSGVVIKDKIIATNYHNYDECNKLYIQHYDKKYDNYRILYANPEKDILIIKINELDLKPIEIETNNNIIIGEKVYALGSPKGYENTITEGIISGIRDTNKILQITAGITHGSSGGAVLNGKGKLIGISNAGFETTNININFATPIEYFIDSTEWCDENEINCIDELNKKCNTYNILTHTFKLINIYYSNNNMGMVFKQLTRVFENDPTNERARELVYYMLKKFSLKSLGKDNVNLLKPYMAEGYNKILEGLTVIENKRDYYNAINIFIDAVNEDSRNKDYYYFLGFAYAKQGNYDSALKCMLTGAKKGDRIAADWLKEYVYAPY